MQRYDPSTFCTYKTFIAKLHANQRCKREIGKGARSNLPQSLSAGVLLRKYHMDIVVVVASQRGVDFLLKPFNIHIHNNIKHNPSSSIPSLYIKSN